MEAFVARDENKKHEKEYSMEGVTEARIGGKASVNITCSMLAALNDAYDSKV